MLAANKEITGTEGIEKLIEARKKIIKHIRGVELLKPSDLIVAKAIWKFYADRETKNAGQGLNTEIEHLLLENQNGKDSDASKY